MSVQFSVEDHVARVTIDRPERLNAIDAATESALIGIWERVERDRDIRVVVVTGAGDRAFSVGADMKDAADTRKGLDYWAAPRPGGFGGLALRDLPVPVIARVNGHALGGALEMVLGCDIVVAARHATFGCPEPRVGRLAFTGGISLLPRRVGHAHAMGLLLTGRRIDAAEAFRIGLVNQVTDLAELDGAVAAWIEDILACAPLTLRATKAMVRAGAGLDPVTAQMLRLPELVEALSSADQDEGVRAFTEKRRPRWTGT